MAITSKTELFTDEPLYKEIKLGSGKTVLMKAMSPQELEDMRKEFANHPKATDGTFLALHGLVRCIIHPETQQRLLIADDVERMATQMHSRDFQPLLYGFNELHGFEVAVEESDPVKKPQTASGVDISGIVSRVNSESPPSISDNMPPTTNFAIGTPILRSKTTQPITEPPS